MRDPRVVHVKVVGTKFVTIFPPAGQHSEECSRRTVPEDRITARPTRPQNNFRTEQAREIKANATLLICRRLLESAVHDAKLMQGYEPTEDALIARSWIEHTIGKPDKTRYELNPIYRVAYRDAFYGSFEWCCEWLEIKDVEAHRSDLLHQVDDAIAKHLYKLRKPSFEARMRELVGWELAKDYTTPRIGYQIELFG